MRRKKMSYKQHSKRFNKAKRRTRAVNSASPMRAGFRF